MKHVTWVLGEFPSSDALAAGARTLREQGFTELDAYSPYPLHGIDDALGLPPSKVPLVAAGGALAGLLGGYLLQTYLNAMDYPINVAGRPIHSPPTQIPITFETTVLLTAFAIFFGLILYFFRFPRPHHPVFEAPGFESATTHGFWMSVRLVTGERRDEAKASLTRVGAFNVAVVEGEP